MEPHHLSKPDKKSTYLVWNNYKQPFKFANAQTCRLWIKEKREITHLHKKWPKKIKNQKDFQTLQQINFLNDPGLWGHKLWQGLSVTLHSGLCMLRFCQKKISRRFHRLKLKQFFQSAWEMRRVSPLQCWKSKHLHDWSAGTQKDCWWEGLLGWSSPLSKMWS